MVAAFGPPMPRRAADAAPPAMAWPMPGLLSRRLPPPPLPPLIDSLMFELRRGPLTRLDTAPPAIEAPTMRAVEPKPELPSPIGACEATG